MNSQNGAKKKALLCAGGTGGHLFPAHALASELVRRGYDIHLVSDERIEKFAGDFPAIDRHVIPSATITRKSFYKLFKSLHALTKGYLAGRRLVRDVKPDIVIGFGGYPTVPPVLAAATKGVPTIIHEANAVLGRANRFLSGRVKAVALGMPLANMTLSKAIRTGNPVRDSVHDAARISYPPLDENSPFHLTIFGGSQGASVFSAVVPQAVGLLSSELRARLRIVQQARAEDETALHSAYQVMDIAAEVKPFFEDMPQKIAESHLVICRSGASTTAELAVIGRPAILIPYPHALDHDQAANAASLAENGGAWVVDQKQLTPQWLSEELTRLMSNPAVLIDAAAKAREQGQPRATSMLAQAVEILAGRQKLDQETLDRAVQAHSD